METCGCGKGAEQSRGIVSNVNVHSKALSVAEMRKYTKGKHCAFQGDYLSWVDSKWTLHGNVVETSIETEALCKEDDDFTYLFPALFPFQKVLLVHYFFLNNGFLTRAAWTFV